MRSRTRKSALLLLGVCVACATAFAADTVIEEIIARVNNAIITRSELIKAREQSIQEVHEKMGSGPAADEEIKKRPCPSLVKLRQVVPGNVLARASAVPGI